MEYHQTEGYDSMINTIKLLALYTNENKELTSGEYIFIHPNNDVSGMTINEIWAGYVQVFMSEETPQYFLASMLKYNLDGERTYSKHIENQIISETDERIKGVERAASPENITYLCIDHWWVTYDNGVVISIIYEGYDCYPVGGNGGNGGTGGSSNELTCDEQSSVFVLAGSAVNGWPEVQITSQTSTTEVLVVKWKIYTAFTWHLNSIEDATTEHFYHINPNGPDYTTVEFTSFAHRNISETGGSWGGTRTFTDLGVALNPTNGLGEAVTERIDFNVKHTPICNNGVTTQLLPPVSIDYYSTKLFVANQLIIQ